MTGISQGARVVGDTLAKRQRGQVAAVVMFGDPRFNPNEPFDVGSIGNRGGLLPRKTGELTVFADVIQDICNGDDGVCQGGGITPGHLRYNGFTGDAAAFVATKV